MSGSLNEVSLIGNLAQDVDCRTMQSGDKVANLSVATNESWRDKDGNKQERAEFHRVVLFGKVAEVAEKYLRKGSKVFIRGQLQTRKWEKDGKTNYTTEVVVRGFSGNMTMLDSGGGGEARGDTYDSDRGYTDKGRDYSADLDDTIPF